MTAFRQAFFLRGQFLGEATRGLCPRTNSRPRSIAFFCPKCGEIWARAAVEGAEWRTSHVECSDCGKLGVVNFPGSVWQHFDDDFNRALPPALFERELEISIEWHQRYIRGGTG